MPRTKPLTRPMTWQTSASLASQTISLLGSLAVSLALVGCGGGSSADPTSTASEAETSGTTSSAATPSGSATSDSGTSTSTSTPSGAPVKGSWQPTPGDTWQWQLSGSINTGYAVTVYDVDLFDAPTGTISALRNSGRRVVCYFSAGSGENWRSDYGQFAPGDLGNALDGWAGERWLDTRSTTVRAAMKKRLDLAKSKGCDGVEPDNVDGYTNNPGFSGALNGSTQLDYNEFLASEAHARGLKIGLKNDIDQVAALAGRFDFAVNEQCHEYAECGVYSAFTGAGKPVFNAEYKSKWRTDANARASLCAEARASGLRTLVLPLNLDDSFRFSCDE